MNAPACGKAGSDPRTLSRFAACANVAVGCLAVAVLVGWAAGVTVLKAGAPGLAPMKVNTALCLLALAIGLLVRRRWVLVATAVPVAAVAVASLAEYVVGRGFGIDELFVSDRVHTHGVPGRMAQVTAICLIALAGAQLSLAVGRHRLCQWLLVVPAGLGSLTMAGYWFGTGQFYAVAGFAAVALDTGVALVALSAAIAALVPGGVLYRAVRDEGVGATAARRLIPVVVVLLPLLGKLNQAGVDHGHVGSHFAAARMVVLSIAVVVAASLVVARRLDVIDAARAEATEQLQRLNAALREGRDAEWQRAEALAQDLSEQRDGFDRALANLDELVWTLEVHPDARLELVYASPNAEALFGGPMPSHGDLIATLGSLVHPDDAAIAAEFGAKLVAGVAAEVEHRLIGFDGRLRSVWSRGTPRREGTRLFFDGATSNVTERRQLAEQREELLRQEQAQVAALREVNRMREEFLAAVGHELRNPLLIIGGYLELLIQTGEFTTVQRDYLDIVNRNAEQLNSLVADLFDLAKLRGGITAPTLEWLALDELAMHAVQAHLPAAEAAGLRLTADCRPTRVQADPARIRQVVDNLITNAIKYTGAGGHVVVRTACTEAGGMLSVTDDGIGIPEEQLPHVFDRFYRAATARANDIPGTGLGLSMAKAIVDAHDGSITVAPNPGRGTVFTVTLPVGPPARVGSSPRVPAQPAAVNAPEASVR